MAELNVTNPDDREPKETVESDHLLPASTHAPQPGVIAEIDDPGLARLQIEQTRARMSDTIEQIEQTLLRKKEHLEERMDVMAPVRRTARENPLPAVAGVFLAGLVFGWLTGGDDDDEEPAPAVRRFAPDFDRERSYVDRWEERSRTWERRARRLMEVANRQEQELMEARGEAVPVRGGRRRFGLRGAERAPARVGGLDGMPLRPRDPTDFGHDPLPAPV